MSRMSQHDQLILVFILFISTFCILMAMLVYKGYLEEVRTRVAIEHIFEDMNITEYNKHMKNYE